MLNLNACYGIRNRSLFAGELVVACYTCAYLRYIRDGSFMLAVFALILILLCDFIKSLMLAYLKRNEGSSRHSEPSREAEDVAEGEEEEEEDDNDISEILDDGAIKAILLRALKYFQIMIVTQTVYSSTYHFLMKLDEKFCRNRSGFTTLLLLGELDCANRGKWFVWFLDILILIFQLILVTNSLTPDSQTKSLTIPRLQLHKYGVLSILRLNLWSEDLVVDGGLQLCIVARQNSGNTRYGSTLFQDDPSDVHQHNILEEDIQNDEMTGLIP